VRYIGIDLGTTNSAISSYDGESVRIYKSPDQHDVTPSAIFLDRRGNRYLGKRAYDNAAKNPDNAAVRFKRMMGTSTPIRLSAVSVTMTPEECSAEILKLCFGYLPEEIRNGDDIGTVITVPAAFNQMQKDATLAAAEMAGLGRVALMQEPVAAVMSVMRQRKGDGIFLVYDLGGGTLDIAIAESISGRVSLLAHGGVAMCGGTDFDREIVDNIVKPWLLNRFQLPQDLSTVPKYKSLLRMCLWAGEKAKIELSARDESVISLSETDLAIQDEAGEEIYVDILLNRAQLDTLMAEKVEESIRSARETIEKAGLTAQDIGRIVFIGGPTQYKPLRDKVAFELGIAPSLDVDTMTAVAEGAAIFAESIDWASEKRGRKSARGAMGVGGSVDISFNFTARTPDLKAKVVVKMGGSTPGGAEFQIDSLDTGWSSGRCRLIAGASIDLALLKPGENTFKVFVFDEAGGPMTLANDRLVIVRTAASIDAIPASQSVGIEVRDRIGGHASLDYLVREGDQLPKSGRKSFKTEESLRAGSTDSINFKLWEGEISAPITDNRFIGLFSIKGTDFHDVVIAAGAELVCDYEISDSGAIRIEVSVPSIGSSFDSRRNFYSRQDAQIDFTKAAALVAEAIEHTHRRLEEMSTKIDDPKLGQARQRLQQATKENSRDGDIEASKQAMDYVQEAKRFLALARQDNLPEIRQMELDRIVEVFDRLAREFSRPAESTSFDNLVRTAQRAIDNKNNDFEPMLDELRQKCFEGLWRQEWFVIDRFNFFAQSAHLFVDSTEHTQLTTAGAVALNQGDLDQLRGVVAKLQSIRSMDATDGDDMMATANIVRV